MNTSLTLESRASLKGLIARMATVFGIQVQYNDDMRASLEEVPKPTESSPAAFNFVVAELATEKHILGLDSGKLELERFMKERICVDVSSLESSEWSSRVIALSDGYFRDHCLGAWGRNYEMMCHGVHEDQNLANFLGLKAMMIDVQLEQESRSVVPLFAKLLRELCFRPSATSRYQSLWLRMRLDSECSKLDSGAWDVWNGLRYMIDHDPQVGIALDLDLPSSQLLEEQYLHFFVDRWMAEPVKAICIPLGIFELNADGYPVLPPTFQSPVGKLLSLSNIHVILYGNGDDLKNPLVTKRQRVDRDSGSSSSSSRVGEKETRAEMYRNCAAYLQHLQRRFAETSLQAVINKDSNYGDSQVDNITAARRYFASLETYRDTLQAPLQPLMDNLESETYETFERDLFKYSQYEAAVLRSMQKFHVSSNNSSTVDTTAKGFSMTIAVMGAGRGPLVDACLRAHASYRRWLTRRVQEGSKKYLFPGVPFQARIFAVEKNENAVRVLRKRLGVADGNYEEYSYQHHRNGSMKADLWNPSVVTVVASDMRHWRPSQEEKADLVVSELLGSFGDNELSPECLVCAQHCTKQHAEFIPYSYTSYLAPVANSKAWMQARDVLSGNGLHTPLVVNQHAYFQLAEARPVFTFEHRPTGCDDKELRIEDNARYTRLQFLSELKASATVHGFVGYFDAVLCPPFDEGEAITISTNPLTITPQMTSWFPIFFPVEVPMTLEPGEPLTASFWRCVSDKRRIVWYEWCVETPVAGKIHNANGTRYSVGLD